MTSQLRSRLKGPSLFLQKVLISGDWADGDSGKTIDVRSQAGDALIGSADASATKGSPTSHRRARS